MNVPGIGTAVKRGTRKWMDRALTPYFDRQAELIHTLATTPGPSSLPIEFHDFNTLLHGLRTVELGRMPRAERVLLSVGCSDASYFSWLEASHGEVAEHWGVELYRPQPPDLPDNVTWYVASASSMTGVDDSCVDVAFSGQNIEHLPAEQIVGFLTEVHRTLRPGGALVLDSPNRLITEPLTWRHPEHVIELSPAEAVELVTLAGFDVTSCRGYWLCQEQDGSLLPLMPDPSQAGEFLRRSVLAADRPDQSFCWWLEARKSDRVVNSEALTAHVAALYGRLWGTRVNRGAQSPGTRHGDGFLIPAGTAGSVYRVGPVPLFEGAVTARVVGEPVDDLQVRILADGGAIVAQGTGSVDFAPADTMFGTYVDVHAPAPTGHDIVITTVDLVNDWRPR